MSDEGFLGDAFKKVTSEILRMKDYYFMIVYDEQGVPDVVYKKVERPSIEDSSYATFIEYGTPPEPTTIIESTATVIDPTVLALPAPGTDDDYIAKVAILLDKSYRETKAAIELSGMSPRQAYEAASSNASALQSAQSFCDAMNTLISMPLTPTRAELEKYDAIFLEIIDEVKRERNDHV